MTSVFRQEQESILIDLKSVSHIRKELSKQGGDLMGSTWKVIYSTNT